MTKVNQFLIVVALFIVGCAHTHRLSQPPTAVDFDEFNKIAKGRKGQIVLLDGRKFSGYDIRVAPSTTSWRDSARTITKNIPTSEINKIQFGNRGRGALEGFGVGVLIGGASAILLGLTSGGGEEFSPITTGVILAIYIGMPAGAVLGTIIGTSVGSKDVFVLADSVAQAFGQ